MSAQGKHRDLPLRVAEVECHRVTGVVIDNFTVGADFREALPVPCKGIEPCPPRATTEGCPYG